MDHGAITQTANGFVEARKHNSPLPKFPGERPDTLADAYAIQDATLTMWDRAIGGWKVGRINPPDDAVLGANRLVGPIFADVVLELGDTSPSMPVFADGFAAAEAEFMLQLAIPAAGTPLPETDEDTVRWLADIRVGIEIASSPYGPINSEGPLIPICDHGNNHGLILGPQVPRDQWADLNSISVTLDIDSKQVGHATTAAMLDGPLGAVRHLLKNLQSRGIAPQSDWWISTGAITGVHPISVGQSAVAAFAGVGRAHCNISAVP